MRKLLLILPMLAAAGNVSAAVACRDKQDAVVALHCSYEQFAESSVALLAAEKAALDDMGSWQRDPFAEDTMEKFRRGSLQFITYRDAECEFQVSMRRVFDDADVIEAKRLDCQISLNSQRIEMLKKLFPPLPVI